MRRVSASSVRDDLITSVEELKNFVYRIPDHETADQALEKYRGIVRQKLGIKTSIGPNPPLLWRMATDREIRAACEGIEEDGLHYHALYEVVREAGIKTIRLLDLFIEFPTWWYE